MNYVHRRDARPFFFTLKAADAIAFAGPLSEALLIQASLDPTVERISYCSTLPLDGYDVHAEAPILHRPDSDTLTLVDEITPGRDPDPGRIAAAAEANSLAFASISASEVRREPLATTTRVIWRQRFVPVDLSMRLALSQAFAEDGWMTLDELCRRVPGPQNPVFQIMALCCAGLLRIDFSEGFSGDTIVRGPR